MKVREKIHDSIKKMDARELGMLYGQIKLMEMMKSRLPKKKEPLSIKKIHEMTSSSESNWSDTVVEDREDRL
ncbi:hypothetical protein M1N10_03700 [Thermodesulfovibrionales bacterium]|nr:hypothetical protein [Thermodesulfovibrionales bacterium]